MKSRSHKIILSIIIAAAASIAIALPFAINYYITFKKDNVKTEKTILIYNDFTYDDVISQIKKSKALKNEKSFIRAAKKREFEKHYEPGRYVLEKGMTNQEIIRTVSNNWETPLKLTLRSHLRTLEDIASFMGKYFESDSGQFIETMLDSTMLSELGFNEMTLIGMFIPDTYEIYWTSSPENILRRLKKEYDNFWTGHRDDLSTSIGLDRNEVMTLASIVSSETNNKGEMPRIAGVYINRINRGMPLQACPTVIYAHKDIEPGIRRVLKRHLKINSPYNTYIHKGLPPGPINIPPVNAIDAVLNYERSDYIYFCAKPEFDGTHNFAATYSKHMKNQRAYNKAFKEKFGNK